ncbi:Ig-like domain repeat protein, partial [Variovorax sp. CAN2819]|nr:Ig-like domain repeat protein [Variovorax sp. CAN15]
MVAIVSGNSLGLSLNSLSILGQRGVLGSSTQGRGGEQSFVNIANGNLVLQDLDDKLIGRGLDINVVRTYNSQGLLNDDNGDNWTVGAFGQRVVLTGTVATAGSTLARTDRDGASATYTWDAARNLYVSSAGAGAFDTIGYDSTNARYTWTDGATGLVERYESTGSGRLISVTDPAGNTVSYAYNANGTLQRMVDANGETIWFDYSGSNLTQVRTAATDGTVLTRVRYAYDTTNRLSSVTVDLNPADNSIADGKVYVTTYTYDGTSKRVASVTQTDGTKHNFSYVEAGGVYKVATVTDALGAVTRFSYDITQNTTTITDPLGAQSTYLYDAQGQLLQMRQGVTAGNPSGLSQISYRYDAAGNVTGVTDGEGREVAYEYDANGNLLKETDSAGNLHTRTYNAANQLLTETVYADAAVSRGAFSQPASLPEITRYIYAQDNPRLLRFVLSPQGGVTEHRYNSYGQALATVRYTGGSYNVTQLGASAVPTEAQMSAWVDSQDLRRTERTDRAYDARGALSSSTTYGEVDASGAGVAATAAKTQYVYDQHGQLLKSIDPGAGTTTYIYDGLSRVLSISAPSLDGGATPNTTITSYDDANGKTSVSIASGLVTVSAYDKAGRLVSVTQQSVGSGVLGTTSNAYDKDGNLLMTQDPTGVCKWMLYDAANRKIADIDATGALVEYVYNASGQLRQTVAYATKLSAAKLAQLVDGANLPTTAWSASNTTTSLAALRPADVAQDQKVWRFYDNAGRLTWQVDALGYVIQTTYDGASRVLGVTQLANPIDVTPLLQGADVDLGVDPTTLGGIALKIDNAAPVPAGRVTVLTAIAEGTPSGSMVTFFDGETVIGSAVLVDGRVSFLSDRLSVGTHNLRVAFSGDALRPASVSKAVKKTITPAVITAELSYSSPTADGIDPLMLSFSLAADAAWLVPQTGKVVFYSDSGVLGEAYITTGLATLKLTSWPTARMNVRAEYAGDAIHTRAIAQRSFVPAPPSITLSSSIDANTSSAPSPRSMSLVASATVSQGEPVRLRARMTPTDTVGYVSFFAGTQYLGSAVVNSGEASLVVNFLPAGTYAWSASCVGVEYNRMPNSSLVVQGGITQIIANQNGLPPEIWNTPPSNPYQVEVDAIGGSPRITISYPSGGGGGNTGGMYSVFDGDVLIGSTYRVPDSKEDWGAISFSFEPALTLSPGRHVLRVVHESAYSGILQAVSSQPIEISQDAKPTVVVWDGSPVNLQAKVSGGKPGGRVTFFAGKICLGVANVINGMAYLVVDYLQIGTYELSATYADADESFSGVVAQGSTIQIKTQDQTNVSSFNWQSVANGSYESSGDYWGFDVYVNAGAWQPNGQAQVGVAPRILVFDNEKSGGVAGTHSIFIDDVLVGSAIYAGNSMGDRRFTFALPVNLQPNSQHRLRIVLNNENVSAPPILVINTVFSVEKASTTTTLSASPARAPEDVPITLNARVALVLPYSALAEPPPVSGLITFYADGAVIGTAMAVNGQASLIVKSLPRGVSNITASYEGDGNYLSSKSLNASPVQVTPPAVGLINLTTASIAKDGILSIRVIGKTPTGLVSFYSGTTLLGTVTVMEDGTATLRGVPIPAGTHTFSTVYSGDELNADGALTFTQLVEGTPSTTIPVSLDIAQDHTATKLFNRNGQLQGALDAEGYLTEYKYNAAGEQIQTIRYANRATNFSSVSARMMAVAIARASGDLTGLRPKDSPNDIRTYSFYNARGQLVGQVDGEGYLTETVYDVRGNVVQTKRYASPAKNPGSASATLATVRPDPSALDQTVTQTWSAANQLLSRTNAEGTITSFTYDVSGRLVQTTTAVGTADERTQRLRYDIQGNLIAELDGRGSAAVAQNDALAAWAANGSTHTYDATGRRTSTTDANGHRTLFFYDALGRLTYTVNALGEVTESRYNAHGLVFEQIVYGTRVNVSTLGASIPGGLNTDTLKAQLAAVAYSTKDTHVLSTYNATGTKTTTVDGLGNTTSYSYNAFREVTASTQTRLSGRVITDTVAFDRRGQQISSTLDSTGAAITRRTSYDAFGRVDTRTDANGNISRLRYDRLGRVVTTTDANGAEHITTYDAFDRVLTQRDALGNTTSYAYNLVDRSVTVTTPEGVSVTTVHNRQGQTSSVTD